MNSALVQTEFMKALVFPELISSSNTHTSPPSHPPVPADPKAAHNVQVLADNLVSNLRSLHWQAASNLQFSV